MSGEQKSRFMKWISPWLLLMEFMWIWLELSRQNLRACHQHRRRHSQYATVINLWWLERRALCGSTKRVLYPKWTYVSSWGRIFWSYGFLHPSEFDQFDHGLVKLFIFFCLKLSWSVYKILTSSHVQRRDMVNNWSDFLLKCFPWTKLNTSNIVSLKKKTTPWVISPSSMKNGWRVTWLKKPRLLKSTNNQRYGVWHPFSYP